MVDFARMETERKEEKEEEKVDWGEVGRKKVDYVLGGYNPKMRRNARVEDAKSEREEKKEEEQGGEVLDVSASAAASPSAKESETKAGVDWGEVGRRKMSYSLS
eukprot:1514379-Rhodomonas_salina.1